MAICSMQRSQPQGSTTHCLQPRQRSLIATWSSMRTCVDMCTLHDPWHELGYGAHPPLYAHSTGYELDLQSPERIRTGSTIWCGMYITEDPILHLPLAGTVSRTHHRHKRARHLSRAGFVQLNIMPRGMTAVAFGEPGGSRQALRASLAAGRPRCSGASGAPARTLSTVHRGH